MTARSVFLCGRIVVRSLEAVSNSMKIGTYFVSFLAIVGCLYLIALTGNAVAFMLCLSVAYPVSICLFFFFLGDILLRFLPANLREIHRRHPIRYRALLLTALCFCLTARWFYTISPPQPSLFQISEVAAILCFTLFLIWSFLTLKRIKFIAGSLILFSFSLSILIVWGSSFKASPETSTEEELAALPYVNWVSAKTSSEKSGVTRYDVQRSSRGVNLYSPSHLPEAYLIDMHGKVLHRWSAKSRRKESWQHIELDKNGDLICIDENWGVSRIGWDSKIKWHRKGRFHHDVAIDTHSNVYVLARRDEIVFFHWLPLPILNDLIVVLSPDGTIDAELSVYRIFQNEIPRRKIIEIYKWILKPRNLYLHFRWALKILLSQKESLFGQHSTPFDIFHSNSLELLPDSGAAAPATRRFLISIRQLNTIATVDPTTKKIIWKWGKSEIEHQHQPTLLRNGNILVFDNGVKRKFSRILEYNPFSNRIVWKYQSNPTSIFYSAIRGGNQRLPNGNTLITDSSEGRVFEVTEDGTVVWEFYSPQRKDDKRTSIYRMTRFTSSEQYPVLQKFLSTND